MIKIINGIYGYKKNGSVIPKTSKDEPFECDEPEADFQPVVEFPQIPQPVAPAPEFSKPEQEGARMERTAPEKVRASVQKPSKKTAPILMEEPKKKKEKTAVSELSKLNKTLSNLFADSGVFFV